MKANLNLIIGIFWWMAFAFVRLLLILFGGFIAVPIGLATAALNKKFFTKGRYKTVPFFSWWGAAEDLSDKFKDANLWELYWEMAWRNPTRGLRGKFKQPVPEVVPNPDHLVRGGKQSRAVRKMEAGFYWEYWSLSKIDENHWAAKLSKKLIGRYWEFRVGWKFVDGNDSFYPTFQIGPKK